MSIEENVNQNAPQEEIYTETVVEYVDNRRQRTILSAILVLLFLLLIGIGWFVLRISQPINAPTREDLPKGVTWIRSIYAFGNTAEQMLVAPVDTAVGPDGTVWTTTNKRVVVGYGPNGDVRRIISRPLSGKPGDFIAIEGIGVSGDGTLYVADYGKNAIMRFRPDGTYIDEWRVQLPIEVDVKDQTVAVASAAGVALFDLDGDLINQWGSRGSGDEEFDLPHGIVIGPDNNIYVSDTQNHRVKAYSREGRLLWTKQAKVKSGLSSKAESETVDGIRQNMQIPSGMTIDGAGRLLLVDPFEFQVLVLDTKKKGQVVARYGEFGSEDGRFGYPTGISYDEARDQFSIADTANNRVQLIRLPNTGGSIVRRGLANFTDKPLWLCSIPLLLLLAAIIVAVRKRRSDKETESASTESRTA